MLRLFLNLQILCLQTLCLKPQCRRAVLALSVGLLLVAGWLVSPRPAYAQLAVPAQIAPETPADPFPPPTADPDPVPAAAQRLGAGQPAAEEPATGLLPLVTKNPWTVAASVSPFILASLIALWFGSERLVVLRRGRVIPKPFVRRFLDLLKNNQLDAPAALELCEQNDSPVAHIFAHGVRKWGRPSVEVEQAIIDGGERQVAHLRKHLRVLNGVATVTPLIGLLGTVVGMMIAFFHLSGGEAVGRAEELAIGIVTALSTTALGLSIAIPSLILYMYLTGRIDSLVMEMDDLAQQVVHRISAEALATRPPERPPSRTRTKVEAVS